MDESLLNSVRNIHAVGRNYLQHIRELENQVPEEPVLFSKSPSGLTCSNYLLFPDRLRPIHFELELVLRLGVAVPVGALLDLSPVSHIALGIDFTARGLQSKLKRAALPWHRAKNFRDACFVAPLRTGFDLGKPFHFRLYQNGELRQDGDSALMMFDFFRLLRFINGTLPFQEGDLVFTGTPAGVGPVQSGDLLRLCCDELETDLETNIGFDETRFSL